MIIDPRDGVEHFLIRCRQTVQPISDVHILSEGAVWVRVRGNLQSATQQAKIKRNDIHFFVERTFAGCEIFRGAPTADLAVDGAYGKARIQAIKKATDIELVIRLLGEPSINIDGLLAHL